MVKAVYKSSISEHFKFGRFHTFRVKWKSIAIISGSLMAAAIILLVLKINIFAFAFLLAVLYPPTLLLLLYVKTKSSLKRKENFENTKTEFTFDPEKEYFHLKITNGKLKEEHEIEYSDLYRAYETKNHFYLYLNEMSALIIQKEMIEGEIFELSEILELRLKDKFISRYKKQKQTVLPEQDSLFEGEEENGNKD